MILLTLPFVFPIIIHLGFDPVWFGIVLNIQSESDLPGGGKFQLDAKGKPTGAILGGIVPLFDKLPKPTFEDKVTGTQKFFSELNRVGVTGLIDPGGFNMAPSEYAPLFNV